ncbi:MAG: RNA polymerase [Flavobacteriales bacterium]|nr:RNA polymerase [Flavobacteriales bacterium]
MKTIAVNINPQYHKTKNQINSEQQLIEEAKKDAKNFRPIYNQYYEIVFRFIFQRIGDEQITTDIVSEVFYRALHNLKKYEFRGLPFSSWLLRIAHNETIKHYRKVSKSRVVKLQTEHLQNLTQEEETNYLEDFKPVLMNALKKLKIEDMQLIEMRFFEERPFKEIAEIMNKKESAIKMKVYRILEKLKVSLQKK